MNMALVVPELPRTLRLVLGVIVFQGAWFACVLGAAYGHVGWGVMAVVVAVALLVAMSTHRSVELRLIAVALATGIVWDSALAASGLVRYASPGPIAALAPVWILALWALWGAVLRDPLRSLHHRPVLAAVLGGVGGALSYAAAARMGACSFDDATLALGVLAAGWAVIVPVQLALARRLEQQAEARR